MAPEIEQLLGWTTPATEHDQHHLAEPAQGGVQLGQAQDRGQREVRRPPRIGVASTTSCSHRDGTPIRAEVDLKLKDAPEDPGAGTRPRGAVTPTASTRSPAASTLHSVAYVEYGDAGAVACDRQGQRHRRPVPDAAGHAAAAARADAPSSGRMGERNDGRVRPSAPGRSSTWNGQPAPRAARAERRAGCMVESDLHAPDCLPDRDPRPRPQRARPTSGFEFLAELTVRAARPASRPRSRCSRAGCTASASTSTRPARVLTIGAYDHSYALFNGLHTEDLPRRHRRRPWPDRSPRRSASSRHVESTSVVHEHVAQVNETHWEFLTRRAREIDYEVVVVGKKLDFRRPTRRRRRARAGRLRLRRPAAARPRRQPAALQRPGHRRAAGDRGRGARLGPQEQAGAGRPPRRPRPATPALPDTPADVASRNGVAPPGHHRPAARDPGRVSTRPPRREAERAGQHASPTPRGSPRATRGSWPARAVSVGQTGGRSTASTPSPRHATTSGTAGYRTQFAVTRPPRPLDARPASRRATAAAGARPGCRGGHRASSPT